MLRPATVLPVYDQTLLEIADEVESSGMMELCEYSYHLHHLRVIKVIDDMLQYISVRHESQRTEHNYNWYFLFDVWQDANDALANGRLLRSLAATSHHVDPERGRRPR